MPRGVCKFKISDCSIIMNNSFHLQWLLKVEKSKVITQVLHGFFFKAFLSLHNILGLLDTNWMHPVGQLIHSTKLEYDE